MSKPRPISTHRELNTDPDKDEPSFSYEKETFLGGDELDVEDCLLRRRLAARSHHRREGSSHGGGAKAGAAAAAGSGNFRRSTSYPTGKTKSHNQPAKQRNASLGESDTVRWNRSQDHWNDKNRRNSNVSSASGGSKDSSRRKARQREAARRLKYQMQSCEFEGAHMMTDNDMDKISVQLPDFFEKNSSAFDRSFSEPSTGSSFVCDMIPPLSPKSAKQKSLRISHALQQCENTLFPSKKKLMLANLDLSASDIPLTKLCGTTLGMTLHKLSLAGNWLGTVPFELVQQLPVLKHLDLSQCKLSQLPEIWNLPKLRRLNLSHNKFTLFPEELMLEGLPELQELIMYGNHVVEISVPTNPSILSKLEVLDLGFNDLVALPAELDQLPALKVLRVMNNYISNVPMRICESRNLKSIDVSCNPVVQPPIGTCERGIDAMRRYWHCIRLEEQQTEQTARDAEKRERRQRERRRGNDKRKTQSFPTIPAPIASASLPPYMFPGPSKAFQESVVAPTPVEEMAGAGEYAREEQAQWENYPVRTTKKPVTPAQSLLSETMDMAEARENITVNDTLKVIFVGMAQVGKTSIIRRLVQGENAVLPAREDRTIGVNICHWDPKNDNPLEKIDSRIEFQDKQLARACGDVHVKFSVWDFAGQHVYHATHELFFSPRALYVIVWDMGVSNPDTFNRKREVRSSDAAVFFLDEDYSGDEDDGDIEAADRALERDIDEKVQFWVDCIQSSTPGAIIIPVASFADQDFGPGGEAEATRRCKILRNRLLGHEDKRIKGLRTRLQEYIDRNCAADPSAMRLRNLLSTYKRPKLFFGDTDEDAVIRVSGMENTGFDALRERIIGIATGRLKIEQQFPLFHGHIGARIPRMRLEVRDVVREMRQHKLRVVEWRHFVDKLRANHNVTNIEDIDDALLFLTNIGEVSYFGGVPTMSRSTAWFVCDAGGEVSSRNSGGATTESLVSSIDDSDDDSDENQKRLSFAGTHVAPLVEDEPSTRIDDFPSSGLSQFIFLSPRWLVAAVACILRHDLDCTIEKIRRRSASGGSREMSHGSSFYDAHLNCPVITSDDACLLWDENKGIAAAAKKVRESSSELTVAPFAFLQMLLIRFGVLVPIDLSIDKAFFSGTEHARRFGSSGAFDVAPAEVSLFDEESTVSQETEPTFFFLPSLLGPCEPADAWSYKTAETWKTTLCHSILYPDGMPPGLMERITASVLRSVHALAERKEGVVVRDRKGQILATYGGQVIVKEVFCWRTAFCIKIGTIVPSEGAYEENIVEIFTHIADRDSHLCVGSKYMGVGMRRLITSGQGQGRDGGKMIWTGGYLLVLKCIEGVVEEYGGLEFEKQGFCPECLARKPIAEAAAWDQSRIRTEVASSATKMRCRHGHPVDTRSVAGPLDCLEPPKLDLGGPRPSFPAKDVLGAVVLVGLFDGSRVINAGSGFIFNKSRGLIVSASHTLINIANTNADDYGKNYFGHSKGQAVIGVIPAEQRSGERNGKDMAEFRYFAKIVAKDPSLDRAEPCRLDACVLRITSRIDQPEVVLDGIAMEKEDLHSLNITEKCEVEEQVRIFGYNQGGEGVLLPGERVNKFVDFARGYVVVKKRSHDQGVFRTIPTMERPGCIGFTPREEIIAICPTISGHSGGPCVNQQGEVIGILSRADSLDSQRCYIAPSSEWMPLVKKAMED